MASGSPIPSPPPPAGFEFHFNQVGLLKNALNVLVLTAPADLGLAAGAGGLGVAVDLFTEVSNSDELSDPARVYVVATGPLPLAVRACLNLELFDYEFEEEFGIRFRLDGLVDAIDGAVGNGDGEGLTLSIKKRNEGEELDCSLTTGQPVQSVVIPFVPIAMGDWPQLKETFTMSFRIPVEQWNRVRDWNAAPAPVNIKVTEKTVEFHENNPNKRTIKLRRQRTKWADMYTLLREPARYPVNMRFSFSPREAVLNAVKLAEDVHNQIPGDVQLAQQVNNEIPGNVQLAQDVHNQIPGDVQLAQQVNNENPGDVQLPQQVKFHYIPGHQCCLEIPVNGLGSIYFRS